MSELLIAVNPNPDSRLPYLLRSRSWGRRRKGTTRNVSAAATTLTQSLHRPLSGRVAPGR